jgi:hypothetical protein
MKSIISKSEAPKTTGTQELLYACGYAFCRALGDYHTNAFHKMRWYDE